MDEDFDEHCTVGHASDPAPNMHCTCWYEGDGCCRCKERAMSSVLKFEQGMDEDGDEILKCASNYLYTNYSDGHRDENQARMLLDRLRRAA